VNGFACRCGGGAHHVKRRELGRRLLLAAAAEQEGAAEPGDRQGHSEVDCLKREPGSYGGLEGDRKSVV
jgi:hypothetical protein